MENTWYSVHYYCDWPLEELLLFARLSQVYVTASMVLPSAVIRQADRNVTLTTERIAGLRKPRTRRHCRDVRFVVLAGGHMQDPIDTSRTGAAPRHGKSGKVGLQKLVGLLSAVVLTAMSCGMIVKLTDEWDSVPLLAVVGLLTWRTRRVPRSSLPGFVVGFSIGVLALNLSTTAGGMVFMGMLAGAIGSGVNAIARGFPWSGAITIVAAIAYWLALSFLFAALCEL